MGYQDYVINADVQDDEKPIIRREMEEVSIKGNTISRDYEIIEEEDFQPTKSVLDEIHEAAVNEGLVEEEEEYIGGENASPEDVINALKNKGRSEGAQKNMEEYAEKKIEKTKRVMATREILTGMSERLITVVVPVVLDMEQENGMIEPELVDLQLKIKRLTESQVNHLFNRRMAAKTVEDMTDEELQEDNHFRSAFLAQAIVEPRMSAEDWYNSVPAIAVGTIYNKVQEVLSSLDNTELFQ